MKFLRVNKWWRQNTITFKPNDWLKLSLSPIVFFCLVSFVWANNLKITNVSLEDRNPTADTLVVEFDISWENAWRTPVNHDAVWLFVKIQGPEAVYFFHADLKTTGNDPEGMSAGSNPNLELYVPSDLKGAFIRFKSSQENPSFQGAAQSTDVRLEVDYSAATSDDTAEIIVDVHGIEMVYIPEGPFFAGDGHSTDTFLALSTTTENVWFISDDNALRTTAAGVCCKYYTQSTSGGNNEFTTGTTFTVPATFPLGYSAFYAMKYEITEGQYVDFLNALNAVQLATNNPVSTSKGTNATLFRNTITGTTLNVVGTSRPDRAMNYLRFTMYASYVEWAALRPMTELEYEKMGRGPLSIVRGEYAWGQATYTTDTAFSISPENGTETFSGSANLGAPGIYTQGDAIFGTCCNSGPHRAGIFADGASNRVQAGAGYYGNMDLSSNVWEWAYSVGNSLAISVFDGTHGDGTLSSAGYANPHSSDPKWSATSVVTANTIAGYRGGHVTTATARFRISDRIDSNNNTSDVDNILGGRGVRTSETADESAAN